MNGKLIVIDGIDGAGKATQSNLLVERLKKDGISVEKIDFPRYGHPFFGELLGECIAGKRGDFVHLDPKIASTLFALDRFEAITELNEWLSNGKAVVADRYSSSNQIHQGGKMVDPAKRDAFLLWAERMEHDVLGVPRPTGTIYLRMPVETSMALLAEQRETKNKEAGEGMDTHEKDKMYMERSYESAEHLAKGASWHTVECVVDGNLRTREDIHEEVYRIASSLLV
jgi:dTMP kinase